MAEKPRAVLRAVLRFGSPRRLRRTWAWLREVAGQVRRRRAEPRLTVAVDVNSFYEPLTGVGWYLHQVLLHLAARDDLRLRLYGQSLVEGDPGAPRPVVGFPAGPAVERVIYDAPDGLVIPPWRARQVLRRLAPLLAAADGNRVLFAPNYLFPPLFRLARGARVATIHDLGVWKVPWAVRPDAGEALRERLDRTLFAADLLLTPSAAVRQELIEMGVAPHRVRAIHHGTGLVGEGSAAALPGRTPRRYALHVGTVEPRKNVSTLLAAWRLLRPRGADPPPLVLCGGFGWKAEEARREIGAAAAEGWLVHLGYVSAEELAALYRGAEMVALPSFYEGFGLPAVEALQAGVPLVASDLPVLREVAGDAALYAPPDRPDLWADRIGELLAEDGLREELRRRGLERACLFDWGRAAAETARAFHEASLILAG
ncbi:MAG TPA: glycosyltransferase family 1 protein [Thermoanaerobaculia bacterium]|jgi:alpha-1,3-rhamnosyl/mannosyltransferase|nr:glycosyltransferase family 1 protein [Thermoanaerobaculia bacterium]